jgi:hypothetical protein
MMFTLGALEQAIRNRLGNEVADRFSRNRSAALGGSVSDDLRVDPATAGALVALVCIPGEVEEEHTKGLPLVCSKIEQRDRAVDLSASYALAHPLVCSVVAEDLGLTLGAMMIAGADMSALLRDCSVQVNFWRDPDGVVGALLIDERGETETVATSHFGAVFDPSRPFNTQRPIYAATFFNIGADAFDLTPADRSEQHATADPALRVVDGLHFQTVH